MANAFFTAYKTRLLGGNTNSLIDWDADTIKVVLIDTADDDPNTSTDDFLDDIAAAARVSTATLASVVISGATVDAADTTFTSVTGDQAEELLIYKDTGVEGTSPLAISFDTFTSGMPITPNGGSIVISWNASGIFTL